MGCGAGGNAVALVMRIKKIEYREAINWLCEWGGSMSATLVRDHRSATLSVANGIHDVHT
jgi:hypothetical protein